MSSDALICSRGSATDWKSSSRLIELRCVPYSRLMVSRLIGMGTEPPVHRRKDAMLVLPPCREGRQVVEHVLGIRVEDVRPGLVNQDAYFVEQS